ncbi:MAG: alpha/beta fold hydrolase [Anaerolineae bacterium]
MNETVTSTRPSYEEAIARIKAYQAEEGADINDVCRTRLWTHGHKTTRALVYFHGYTNCPAQFDQLGEILYEKGLNVYVPRLEHHGLKDVMSTDQANLTSDMLVRLTNESIDIAHGLGESVTVMGLSAGGVMAAYAAQFRSDVDLAVVISPSFGLPFLPAPVSDLAKWILPVVPNMFIWWDPRVKEKIEGPSYGYPRFSTHALMNVFKAGDLSRVEAKSKPPAAKHVVVITSDSDTAIHLETARDLAKEWWVTAPDRVQVYTFPKEQHIIHDMIDPRQTAQRVDVVYPVILQYLGV